MTFRHGVSPWKSCEAEREGTRRRNARSDGKERISIQIEEKFTIACSGER